MSISISPIDAARVLGVGTFELARLLRGEAAQQLVRLAGDIERGGESSSGDVDRDEYDNRLEAAWRLVESAKACDADWQESVNHA